MSRRTHRQDGEDALELFLDAMSNMFGGVVFIAVTIIILLQFTARPAATSPDDRVTTPQENAEPLRQEIYTLQDVLASTQTQTLPATESDQQRYAVLKSDYETAAQTIQNLISQVESQQNVIDSAQTQADELTRLREQIEAHLLEARKALEDAQSQTPQRLRIPRYQSTTKREFPVLLSSGRLVSVFESTSAQAQGSVNRADLEIDPQNQTVRARPGRGVTIESRQTLVERFKHLSPNQHYISLAVWPDSFNEALTVRDTLIDLGFEYGLTFIQADAEIPFRAASGVQ